MLPMARFPYNDLKHSSTNILTFYAIYKCKPKTNWPIEIEFLNPASEMSG